MKIWLGDLIKRFAKIKVSIILCVICILLVLIEFKLDFTQYSMLFNSQVLKSKCFAYSVEEKVHLMFLFPTKFIQFLGQNN